MHRATSPTFPPRFSWRRPVLARRCRALSRNATAMTVLAGASLILAASGRGANLLQNPGFEADCGGVPCNWASAGAGATLARDTTVAHEGAASLRLTLSTAGVFAVGDCLSAITAGTYDVAFWYRAVTYVGFIQGGYSGYPSSDCTGSAQQRLDRLLHRGAARHARLVRRDRAGLPVARPAHQQRRRRDHPRAAVVVAGRQSPSRAPAAATTSPSAHLSRPTSAKPAPASAERAGKPVPLRGVPRWTMLRSP
jgi:hypothetical protein